MLKTRSVQSPISPQEDGLRILVTRFRGRVLPGRLMRRNDLRPQRKYVMQVSFSW
jgi:hypothetical protein